MLFCASFFDVNCDNHTKEESEWTRFRIVSKWNWPGKCHIRDKLLPKRNYHTQFNRMKRMEEFGVLCSTCRGASHTFRNHTQTPYIVRFATKLKEEFVIHLLLCPFFHAILIEFTRIVQVDGPIGKLARLRVLLILINQFVGDWLKHKH